MNIVDLKNGEIARVIKIDLPKPKQKKLFALGVDINSIIKKINQAPMRGAIIINVLDFNLAVRRVDAQNIFVEKVI